MNGRMPYIIDGNNLLGCAQDICPEEPESREKLIELVGQYQTRKNCSITLVFDGHPSGGVRVQELSPKYTVLYPHVGNSADHEIKEIMEGLHYFRDVTLVTSDGELRRLARQNGARLMNSQEFYFLMKRTARANGKLFEKHKRMDAELSEKEVNSWLKVFERMEGNP